MRQVRRCFVAAGGEPRSTSQILPWVYPELDRFKHWHRWSARIWIVCPEGSGAAERGGRVNSRGRQVAWRASEPGEIAACGLMRPGCSVIGRQKQRAPLSPLSERSGHEAVGRTGGIGRE
jgi:hypothetical protein